MRKGETFWTGWWQRVDFLMICIGGLRYNFNPVLWSISASFHADSLAICGASWRLLRSVESAFRRLPSTIITPRGQMLSKNFSKTLSHLCRSRRSRRPLLVSSLCFFCFFFAFRQYPSKGQSTLWQMRSFFHVNFWCFLPQYDATMQLAQLKGTDPCLTRCLQE